MEIDTVSRSETDGPVVFGLTACMEIGLVSIHCTISAYKDEHTQITSFDHLKGLYTGCFDGLGKLPGSQRLILKDGAKPVIYPEMHPNTAS